MYLRQLVNNIERVEDNYSKDRYIFVLTSDKISCAWVFLPECRNWWSDKFNIIGKLK